jgi:hypothetical protein
MGYFTVRCAIGEDCVDVEVPTDSSVGDVLQGASEKSGKKGTSIWFSDIQLNCEHLFADYFEPEAMSLIRLGHDYPDGSLLQSSGHKLDCFAIDLTNVKILMEVKAGPFDMEEFEAKVVKPKITPTVLVVEWKAGFVIGGFAAVPWPKDDDDEAADPDMNCFIFSLEPNARRFDLGNPHVALLRGTTEERRRGFGFGGGDLHVFDDGTTWTCSDAYAGGRRDGFPSDCQRLPFVRFELWSL